MGEKASAKAKAAAALPLPHAAVTAQAERIKKIAAKKAHLEKKPAAKAAAAKPKKADLEKKQAATTKASAAKPLLGLNYRTLKEDWPILLEEVRLCCCGVNCINMNEEEEPEYFCHMCSKYSHYMCCRLINETNICNQCASGV